MKIKLRQIGTSNFVTYKLIQELFKKLFKDGKNKSNIYR